ncbi:olfactory receptor 14I1 [Toxotes jaculatrix]|uniref:olfactory receptor 14I1 n=1 Tax=Toxotes jaculatrix TaxID=941984 RepID=UPI001B3AB246|nr:olfactory receptor 14I1 [Toxotes jaculatrix]
MTATEAHNLTQQCDWLREENRTEPRVTGRLDAAGCFFLYIMPNGQAVPALICIFVLLTLVSFLINGLTLFGLGRSEDLSWEPRFAFLKNLILSDLVQTVTFSPAVIHSLVQRRTMEFNTWCHLQYFAGSASIFASLVTITCMALERYLYVCHAIHYLVILTQVRLRITLGLIWVYSISIGTINMVLLHMGTGEKNEQVTKGLLCEPDIVEQHMGFPRAAAVFRKLVGSFTLLLCLLVYAFSYVRMYQDARNAVIPFNAVNTTARKTVLFYCGMLFLQLLPLLLKVTSDALWEFEGTVAMMALSTPSQDVSMTKTTPSATAVVLHMSLLIMLVVPPCINPLVYGLRNAEVRQALISLFRWWLEKRGTGARGVEMIRVRDIVHQNRAQAG